MVVRVEAYQDGDLTEALSSKITALLAHRWPVAWDVKLPVHATIDHPAEWRAVVPIPEGKTPEILHQEVASEILAVDPTAGLHFRTRWAPQQMPDEQDIFDERWKAEEE